MRLGLPYRFARFAATFACVLSLTGCGSDGYVLAPVSGRVTIDDEAFAGVRIAFEPVAGESRPIPGPESIAVTDAEGRYKLYTSDTERSGAVVGKCRVRIWTLPDRQNDVVFDDRDPKYDSIAEIKAIKAKIRDAAKKAARPKGIIPFRYNDQTELTFEVPAEGTDKADFKISWK